MKALPSLNESGMSLISVLMSSAVLGIVLAGMSNFMVWQMKAVGHSALKGDLNTIKAMMTDRVAAGVDCGLTTAYCNADTPDGKVIALVAGISPDGSPTFRVPEEGVVVGRFRVHAVCLSDNGTPSYNFRVGPASQEAGAQIFDPLTRRSLANLDLLPGPRPVCGGGGSGGQTPEQICVSLGGYFVAGKCQGLGGGVNLVAIHNPDANGDGKDDGLQKGMNPDQGAVVSCLSNGVELFAGQTSCNTVTPFLRDWNGNIVQWNGPIPTESTCYFRQEKCPATTAFFKNLFCATASDGKWYLKFPNLPDFQRAGLAGKPQRGWSMGGRWCTGGVMTNGAST